MQISCRYHYFNKKNDAHMKFIDILVLVKIIIKEVYTDITSCTDVISTVVCT